MATKYRTFMQVLDIESERLERVHVPEGELGSWPQAALCWTSRAGDPTHTRFIAARVGTYPPTFALHKHKTNSVGTYLYLGRSNETVPHQSTCANWCTAAISTSPPWEIKQLLIRKMSSNRRVWLRLGTPASVSVDISHRRPPAVSLRGDTMGGL